MDVLIERVDVWAAPIKDQPGGLAKVLAGLRDAGCDLDFVIARRSSEKPGEGVVFVTPIRGDAEVEAASNLGFNVTSSIHALRIEGDNEPGVGADMTRKLAAEGINLRGFSGAVLGAKYILFIGFDTEADAEKATRVLQSA
jgi:hypothetical protein